MIYSAPFGAEVALGDSIVGTTPLVLPPFGLMSETIGFRFPGFVPVTLRADSLLGSPPPHRVELVPLDTGGRDARPRWGRRAAWALAGSALAAGGAVLAKERADHEFERYLHAGSRQLQARYFDRAERWDRVSVAGWGLTQVGAALAVYFMVRWDEEGSRPAPVDAGWKPE
jgi:hypothetical protein